MFHDCKFRVVISRLPEAGKVLGYCELHIETPHGTLISRDWCVISGDNGMFVGVPSKPDKEEPLKFWRLIKFSKGAALEGEIRTEMIQAVTLARADRAAAGAGAADAAIAAYYKRHQEH